MAQTNLREVCKCGHDKVTHHEGKYNCLGMFCNDCKKYVNEWAEDEPITERIPPSEPEDWTPHWTISNGGKGFWP